ncbi:fumarylacetoacetate hydrolase family protein [Prauserella halophila]|uniref:fumarylacetoacetate hydrolase family protein n=1 Tax=Prauserella halophila TaxID=185641 RepID=UPI003558D48F
MERLFRLERTEPLFYAQPTICTESSPSTGSRSPPCPAPACHTLGEVVAHASRSEHLRPGELLGTGTLPGGSGMETGRRLRPGDTLLLSLDGIGSIEHPIIDS